VELPTSATLTAPGVAVISAVSAIPSVCEAAPFDDEGDEL
jgi:hypothetical protein